MNRQDFYFEQLVTQADMDSAFDSAELADQRIVQDNGLTGVLSGLVVSQEATPDLTVDISAGVAYDGDGQRIAVGSAQNLDLSVDSNAVSTAVATPGNEKWLSVFIAFDRALSDPRIDGNGSPLQYIRAESFQFIVDQGAEASAGTQAVYTSGNSENYALVDGQTLLVSVDGQEPQTATFNTADFAAIGAATAAEVAAVITADITGVSAADSGGNVQMTSDSNGPGASIFVVGGSAAAAFSFPAVKATGSGGPARPALRADAILLADVLLRNSTTQVFDKPDQGSPAGVIDLDTRRQIPFIYSGTGYDVKANTLGEFAVDIADLIQAHVDNAGNAHSATAIAYAPSSPFSGESTVQDALDAIDAYFVTLTGSNTVSAANTWTGANTFRGNDFIVEGNEHLVVKRAGVAGSLLDRYRGHDDVAEPWADAAYVDRMTYVEDFTITGSSTPSIITNIIGSSADIDWPGTAHSVAFDVRVTAVTSELSGDSVLYTAHFQGVGRNDGGTLKSVDISTPVETEVVEGGVTIGFNAPTISSSGTNIRVTNSATSVGVGSTVDIRLIIEVHAHFVPLGTTT